MRLLEVVNGEFRFTQDLVSDIPRYAILSHTWGADTEEVTFHDLIDSTGQHKLGWEKIKFCAEQARRDCLRYFWIDTCCIDKSNLNELSTAINSMFRWYQNAARCYVYLTGISAIDPNASQLSEAALQSAFKTHRWFTRGWTLQELLAPASVEFFTQDGHRLGDKTSLEHQIHEITGIAFPALRGSLLFDFNINERFKWAETRQTKLEEDWVYCLFGIFGVFMPPIYGEGKAHALRRLMKEINSSVGQERTPEPKDGIWMVPFERNPSFTGREPEIKRLEQMLFKDQHTARVSVQGLGGVGKTQLALEVAYRVKAEHRDCSVIWMPATSRESLEQAYLKAARLLGIPGREDSKDDIKALVQTHLSSPNVGRWLLLIDNADDLGMWLDKPEDDAARLIDCLPRSSLGSILFTTRDRKAAVTLAGKNVMELSEMDEAQSRVLLQGYLIDQDLGDQDAAALLLRLAYLPLAMVQAAAYINANKMSVGDYLSLLVQQEEEVIELLSQDFEDETRYREVSNPVATTWLISFEQIRQRNSLAADYLSFMACLDAKDIPRFLLPPGPSRKEEMEAIGTLQGYSFITRREADSTTINIHRLVHLATRNWLRKEGLLPRWSQKATRRLEDALDGATYYNEAEWRPCMSHAHFALEQSSLHERNELQLSLTQCYGWCLHASYRYSDAEVILQGTVDASQAILGASHHVTLKSTMLLSNTYYRMGKYKEGKQLLTKLLLGHRTHLETENPGLLAKVLMNLANISSSESNYDDSERLELEVISLRSANDGPDHRRTLNSKSNLALTYMSQSRFEMAERLLTEAVETYRAKSGLDHPRTINATSSLALCISKQGRVEEAERLLLPAFEAGRRELGTSHQDTLYAMGTLARVWKDMGRVSEAVGLLKECVELSIGRFGREDSRTVRISKRLAKWQAEDVESQALAPTTTSDAQEGGSEDYQGEAQESREMKRRASCIEE